MPLRSLLIPAYIPHEQHFLLGLGDSMSGNYLFVVDRDVIFAERIICELDSGLSGFAVAGGEYEVGVVIPEVVG